MINKRGRAEEVITNIAECPVCLDSMIDKDLFQCTEGHLVCGSCYGRLIAPKKCAKCRGKMMTSRCTAMELFMKQIPLYECPHIDCHRKFTSMECSIDHALNDSEHKCEGEFSIYERGHCDRVTLLGLRGEGKLTHTYKNGGSVLRYEGGMKDGLRHGQAKIYHNDRTTIHFDGRFKNGEVYSGKRYNRDGTLRYDGTYQNNKPHGRGKSFYRHNGESPLEYDGEFRNGVRHGRGKSFRVDGSVEYAGQYENGKRHGRGKFFRVDGSVEYAGQYENGTFHGEGTHRDLTGINAYTGMWKEGRKHGSGITFFVSNTTNTIDFVDTKDGVPVHD